MVILIGGLGFGWGAATSSEQVKGEVDDVPQTDATLGEEHAEEPATSLPSSFPQGSGDSQNLDELLILDQPTADSAPQPDQTEETSTEEDGTNPGAFSLRLLDGGGVADAMDSLKDTLTTHGYTVLSTGAAIHEHPTTTLYYQPGFKAQAESVAPYINASDVAYVEDQIAAPADVLIVVGQV